MFWLSYLISSSIYCINVHIYKQIYCDIDNFFMFDALRVIIVSQKGISYPNFISISGVVAWAKAQYIQRHNIRNTEFKHLVVYTLAHDHKILARTL